MKPKLIRDQIGQIFTLPPTNADLNTEVYWPKIVSLVPSLSELIADLGLKDNLVGVSKFCTRGGFDRKKLAVGGTKNPNINRIKNLKPDWIFANKEENRQEDVAALSEAAPVWVSDIKNLADNYHLIASFGTIFACGDKAAELIEKIRREFDELATFLAPKPRPKVAYLIWENPIMVAGGDTFIQDMLNWAGFENVFADANRYPTVTEADLLQSGAELLLLSSEPFPFGETHLQKYAAMGQNLLPILVNGEFFSWYGSRPLLAAGYFRQFWQDNEQALLGVAR